MGINAKEYYQNKLRVTKDKKEIKKIKDILELFEFQTNLIGPPHPKACFVYCDSSCYNDPYHSQCPGYDDLQ